MVKIGYLSKLSMFALFFYGYTDLTLVKSMVEEPVKLTDLNFHQVKIMDNPWIIAIIKILTYEKSTDLASMATSLIGRVQVGFIDMNDRETSEVTDALETKTPGILVYQYGKENKKKPTKVSSLQEAREVALNSYPDKLTRIYDDVLLAFYVQAMEESKPPKMPVIYITDKDEIPHYVRCASVLFKDDYAFGKLIQPSQEILSNFSVTSLPHLVTMLTLSKTTGAFELVPYDRKAFGKLCFRSLTKYLYGIQQKFGDLKSNKLEETKTAFKKKEENIKEEEPVIKSAIPEATSLSLQRICSAKMKGLCVIAFLDTTDRSSVRVKQNVLDNVRTSERLRDFHIRYFWMNFTCYESYANIFGIFGTKLPRLAVISPESLTFAVLNDKMSYSRVREFIMEVLSGKKEMKTLAEYPIPEYRRCRSIGKTKRASSFSSSGSKKKDRSPRLRKTRNEL